MMKTRPRLFRPGLGLVLCALAAGWLHAADLRVRQLALDMEGRFWVYRNGPAQPLMPFSPYGWMSDSSNLTQLIHVDLDCRDHPNTAFKNAGPPEIERCIKVRLNWDDATWASVAFISGPDKPPWWGDTNTGRYYNLSTLARKKLVFYARGEHGDEAIKIQIGMLADKPFGDSLKKPLISDEFRLTDSWVRHEVDLSQVPGAELAHICNGFGFIVERASQPSAATETVFYLDDVYFE